MRYAVIDIGSNSVRLLLWADGSFYKKTNTTRLGEGIALSPRLLPAAIERSAQAVAEFCREAAGADGIFAFATAAVRRAENGAEFVARVKELCGIDVDVISGEREAELGLFGALEGRDGGIIDVGGASTEVTVGVGGKVVYAVSADIGAVRLRGLCGEDRAALEARIADALRVYGEIPRAPMTAVGGTATSLAALEYGVEPYDPACIHGKTLTRAEVLKWADKLLSMPQEERLLLKGMDKRRADILGGAALLLARVMERAGAESIRISERDNLEGYLDEKLANGGVL